MKTLHMQQFVLGFDNSPISGITSNTYIISAEPIMEEDNPEMNITFQFNMYELLRDPLFYNMVSIYIQIDKTKLTDKIFKNADTNNLILRITNKNGISFDINMNNTATNPISVSKINGKKKYYTRAVITSNSTDKDMYYRINNIDMVRVAILKYLQDLEAEERFPEITVEFIKREDK